MYNLILDGGIYIYHQTKRIAQSKSSGTWIQRLWLFIAFIYLPTWVKMIWVKTRDSDFYYALMLWFFLDELLFIILISLFYAS